MALKIVNTAALAEDGWASPQGKFAGADKSVSEALGREPQSSDFDKRHPFDVAITRIPPGKRDYPYHAHSAQWEFYHVISGTGAVRHAGKTLPIRAGDAFLCKPGEPHQLINDGAEDLVVYVIADNPFGDTCYYPDSGKWSVRLPERQILRGAKLPYYEDEE